MLKAEFAEHGTKLVALNAQTADSPEGELHEGILDQFAAHERAKIAERTRRGKLQKARQGKLLCNSRAHYGFKHDETGEAYVIDEEEMTVVRRIFREVAEGRSLHSVKRALDLEGVPTPSGGRYWGASFLRTLVLEDVYRPHAYAEIEGLVSPEVAARLDEGKSYGIFWSSRTRTTRKRVSETSPDVREYRWRYSVHKNPKEHWIAIPVPDTGLSREIVDVAREMIRDNKRKTNKGAASSSSVACSTAAAAARRCSIPLALRRDESTLTTSAAASSVTAKTPAQPASIARCTVPRSWRRRSGSLSPT
jgi:site-specific DNA recombinase